MDFRNQRVSFTNSCKTIHTAVSCMYLSLLLVRNCYWDETICERNLCKPASTILTLTVTMTTRFELRKSMSTSCLCRVSCASSHSGFLTTFWVRLRFFSLSRFSGFVFTCLPSRLLYEKLTFGLNFILTYLR